MGSHFLLQGKGIFLIQGVETVSPALAGRFFTTEPPGKPELAVLQYKVKKFLKKKAAQVRISDMQRETNPQGKGSVNQRLLPLYGPHRLGKQGRERVRNGDTSQGEKYLSQDSQ